MAFVAGGMKVDRFEFSPTIAHSLSSFMFVAVGALILPAAFSLGPSKGVNMETGVLALSRGAAVVLLIIYMLFLIYQLRTHNHVFNPRVANDGEAPVEATVSPWAAAVTIFVVAVAVSFCSDYLVSSVDDVIKTIGISKTFIGLILIPIVGNAGTSQSLYIGNLK
jgi:Ca2+:H+ antiporter